MGRKYKGGKKRRSTRGDKGQQDEKRMRVEWEVTLTENPDFEEYYKEQNICPEGEWDDFMGSLKRQLPLTFRINGSGRFADALRKKLECDFLSKFSSEGVKTLDGETVNPPKPLPWYPNRLAWQLEFSRTQLRKDPNLEALHEFMKRETEVGAITRQEAVSMIPPLFLDVKPHHRVLDLCAAPGSKTFQLLEALHGQGSEPSGVVIANDADVMRCSMLTHQAQRMRSPSIIITNHEAQNFPAIVDSNPDSDDSKVMYDRILCDVPCSGDGTARKQPDIWGKWTVANGNGLHNLQIRIGLRACEILRVGGRMVYSTCTFNPIEDEAVVAEILRRTNGAMRLVDVSSEVQNLKYQPGMKTWRVKEKGQGKWHDTWEEGMTAKRLQETMFPKGDEDALNLHFAMRFLPHHQNTGGFFVTVLEKLKPTGKIVYPSRYKSDVPSSAPRAKVYIESEGENLKIKIDLLDNHDTNEVRNEKTESKNSKEKVLPPWGIRGGGGRNRTTEDKGKWTGIDPIVPFTDKQVIDNIKEFYGISEDSNILDGLISRNADADKAPKRLLFISSGPKLLLQMDIKEALKVVACGLKMFERQSFGEKGTSCEYRIAQEGVSVILPYLTKQILYPNLDEFISLLRDRALPVPQEHIITLTDHRNAEKRSVDNDDLKKPPPSKPQGCYISDPKTLQELPNIRLGCCIALMREDDLSKLGLGRDSNETQGGLAANSPFAVPCWRGRTSINIMVSKLDCAQMLDRLEMASPGITTPII
eukprot:jgi/Picsp_1/2882/NSC_01107-R1_protein